MVKIVFILMVLLFLIPIAFADVTYTEVGEADGFFIRGNGVFNENLDIADTSTSTVVLGDPEQVPLVSDLNGDGVQEIIVINDENIIIFQNKTLDIATSFSLNATTTDTFSNMIIFDIDGDGTNEIIVVSETRESLQILNYTDSLVTQEATFSMEGLNHTDGKITIGCESANRCLMTYGQEQFNTGVLNRVSASFFNSTFLGNEIELDTTTGSEMFCPPTIRRMMTANYDLQTDTDVEFIVSYIHPHAFVTAEAYEIYYINIESDNTVTLEQQSTFSSDDDILEGSSGTFTCDNKVGSDNSFDVAGGFGEPIPGKLGTNALTFDADPANAGLETIMGFMVDNNEFKIKMFKSDGTEIRDFPLVQDSEGQLLGNVFRAEIFDDSNTENDFCVLSQQSTDDKISLTCGSLTDTNGVGLFNTQTIEFRLENSGLRNVTDQFNHWGILAHAVEYDSSNSVSEITSTWGVFEPEFSGILCTFGIDAVDCPLDLQFTIPAGTSDGTVVPVDLDNNNLEDFLILTQTNLFYLDDGFQNEGVNEFCGESGSTTGICSSFTTNPCIDSVWKVNTSVEITVTAIDPEADLVQVSATLYEGDSNEQSQTSGNVSSGTTVPFSFEANKTIGAGSLVITAVDIIENPLDVESVTKTFSVAPNGVEFNDCISTFQIGVITAEEEEALIIAEGSLTEDATDNSITRGVFTFVNLTDLGGTTIWLILMLAFSVGIFVRASDIGWSGNSALGAIGILNALFIIIGVRLGILSVSLVVILVILGVVILSVFLGKFITGVSSNSA